MEDDVGNKTVLEVLEEGEREVKVPPSRLLLDVSTQGPMSTSLDPPLVCAGAERRASTRQPETVAAVHACDEPHQKCLSEGEGQEGIGIHRHFGQDGAPQPQVQCPGGCGE